MLARALPALRQRSVRTFVSLPRTNGEIRIQHVRLARPGRSWSRPFFWLTLALLLTTTYVTDLPRLRVTLPDKDQTAHGKGEDAARNGRTNQCACGRQHESSGALPTYPKDCEKDENGDEDMLEVSPEAFSIPLSAPLSSQPDQDEEQRKIKAAAWVLLLQAGGIGKLRDRVADMTMRAVAKDRRLMAQLGSPIRKEGCVLHIRPDAYRPRPSYHRFEFAVTDKYLAIVLAPVDATLVHRWRLLLWPKPTIYASYASAKIFTKRKYERWKEAMAPVLDGLWGRETPSQSQQVFNPSLPPQLPGSTTRPQDRVASNTQTRPTRSSTSTPLGSDGLPPSQTASANASASKTGISDRQLPMLPPWLREAFRDPDAQYSLGAFRYIADRMRRAHMHALHPQGVITANGLLEVRGSRAGCIISIRGTFYQDNPVPVLTLSVSDVNPVRSVPRGPPVSSNASEPSRS